jgi:photosystem II stability/assembly factor-like uncharacterized protein
MNKIFMFLSALSFGAFSQSFIVKTDTVKVLNSASIRGMSVVDDSVAWISGSMGTVARTINGGRSWEKIAVKGHERRDFRSIEAFDKNIAYIANAGDSAKLLATYDGGRSWKEICSFNVKGVFFDAVACWDQHKGLVLSDPVNGVFLLPYFENGKVASVQTCSANAGEACFAASGTCLRTGTNGNAWFVTGGGDSRIFYTHDYGKSWENYPCPVIKGKPSQGAFSVAFADSLNGIVVGGDYGQATLAENNCFITSDGGKTWSSPKSLPGGYRSCVEHIGKKEYVCTGLSGTDLSKDKGRNWSNIDQQAFNVVRKAKKGLLVLLAGDGGRVGVLRKK